MFKSIENKISLKEKIKKTLVYETIPHMQSREGESYYLHPYKRTNKCVSLDVYYKYHPEARMYKFPSIFSLMNGRHLPFRHADCTGNLLFLGPILC